MAKNYPTPDLKARREQWRASQPQRCWDKECRGGALWLGLQVHEIERKSQAPKRWCHECNFALLCAECHGGRWATMPHAKQLAYKLVHDPEHFDLGKWLSLQPRGPRYVTMADISEHLPLELVA